MDTKLLLKPQEAADSLGISRSKCYDLVSRGEIPSIKVGGSVRVPVDALREWISRELAARVELSGR